MGQAQSLQVRLNGEMMGTWSIGREHSFQYAESWLDSPLRRSLSLSMPLTGRHSRYSGKVVENFFEIGKDCVGAAQLLPEGDTPLG